MKSKELVIKQPDDWHCHLRDDEHLSRTVADSAKQFHRVIAMPNLMPPITDIEMAKAYRERILKHVPNGFHFAPLMTLYLTENTPTDLMSKAKKSGIIFAAKLYPAGVTTHSSAGVVDYKKLYVVFEQMQAIDLPLCVHGESVIPEADIFDREKLFLSETLSPLLKQFPKLRVILEHISTKAAVELVKTGPNNLAATITPHHLHFNRNAIFQHGIHPHYFCKPILNRAEDQSALIQAAISGHPRFFLGTDSAPHSKNQKEQACGCAGIYSAHNALAFYADIFERYHALDRLEKFASVYGAEFYHMPLNQTEIALVKCTEKIPDTLSFGQTILVPMKAGENITWQIK